MSNGSYGSDGFKIRCSLCIDFRQDTKWSWKHFCFVVVNEWCASSSNRTFSEPWKGGKVLRLHQKPWEKNKNGDCEAARRWSRGWE